MNPTMVFMPLLSRLFANPAAPTIFELFMTLVAVVFAALAASHPVHTAAAVISTWSLTLLVTVCDWTGKAFTLVALKLKPRPPASVAPPTASSAPEPTRYVPAGL